MIDADEEARREIRRKIDIAAYRALGVLQALRSVGMVPACNVEFVDEIIAEHDKLRAQLDGMMASRSATTTEQA